MIGWREWKSFDTVFRRSLKSAGDRVADAIMSRCAVDDHGSRGGFGVLATAGDVELDRHRDRTGVSAYVSLWYGLAGPRGLPDRGACRPLGGLPAARHVSDVDDEHHFRTSRL